MNQIIDSNVINIIKGYLLNSNSNVIREYHSVIMSGESGIIISKRFGYRFANYRRLPITQFQDKIYNFHFYINFLRFPFYTGKIHKNY